MGDYRIRVEFDVEADDQIGAAFAGALWLQERAAENRLSYLVYDVAPIVPSRSAPVRNVVGAFQSIDLEQHHPEEEPAKCVECGSTEEPEYGDAENLCHECDMKADGYTQCPNCGEWVKPPSSTFPRATGSSAIPAITTRAAAARRSERRPEMGMQYDVSFNDATIKPENYGQLINWTPEEVAAEPKRAAELALTAVTDLIDDWDSPEQNDDGIHLYGEGYHDSAGYGFMDDLLALLDVCEPGAWLHSNDAEEGQSPPTRYVVQPDRTVRAITAEVRFPGIDWPEDLDALIADGRKALAIRGRDSARAMHYENALRALVEALDPRKEA